MKEQLKYFNPNPKEQYFVKRGKRYVPVNDPYAYDGLDKGEYLVVVNKSCKSIRTQLNPKFAELDAALYHLEEGLTRAIARASEIRPSHIPLSKKERRAWKAFDKILGKDKVRYFAEFASYSEIARKGCEYVREIMLEHNCSPTKIKEVHGIKSKVVKDSISSLEI